METLGISETIKSNLPHEPFIFNRVVSKTAYIVYKLHFSFSLEIRTYTEQSTLQKKWGFIQSNNTLQKKWEHRAISHCKRNEDLHTANSTLQKEVILFRNYSFPLSSVRLRSNATMQYYLSNQGKPSLLNLLQSAMMLLKVLISEANNRIL